MRKILFGLFICASTVALAPAQDAATQQLIDQITGKIQDLTDMQAEQGKKITALEKQISDLSDKLNQPAANNNAGADDLQKLAEQVRKLAEKQQHDNDQIVNTLEKLGKGGGVSTSNRKIPVVSTDNPGPPATAGPGGKQNGYYYPVQDKDTLIAIAKAYSTQLKTKITVDQILAANPGLTAKNLIVGKKIFIPAPAQ